MVHDFSGNLITDDLCIGMVPMAKPSHISGVMPL